MAKPDTYMPLVIGDYLKDTMHLTAQEHGAYLLAIMNYWTSGPLPDDDRKLAAICRVERADWPGVRETLSAFFQIADGVWRHKRVDEELARAQNLIDQSVRGGKTRASKAARGPDGKLLPASPTPAQQPAPLDEAASPPGENVQPNTSPATATAEDRLELYPESPRSTIPASRKIREPALTLPRDWVADDADRGFAERMGLSAVEIAREQTKFAAYWSDGKGGGTRRTPKGWRATWQNWITKTAERGLTNGSGTRENTQRRNPADATSADAVADRRAALAQGFRDGVPGLGGLGFGATGGGDP